MVLVVGEEVQEGGLEEDGEVCLRGWGGSLWRRWRGSRESWRCCMFVGRGGFELRVGLEVGWLALDSEGCRRRRSLVRSRWVAERN